LPTLRIEGLCKSYGPVVAVADVSFSVDGGTCFGLLGPNGAGKSTVLHTLGGLTSPDKGDFVLDDCSDESGSQITLRHTLGFAPDDLPMPDLLSGIEYLELLAGLRHMRINSDELTTLAETVRLGDALQRLVGDYSHGMRRKLSLLGAMMHSPEVLVLDEPMRGLDPETNAIVKNVIRHYTGQGKIVILSTHDMLVASQMCDRILIMDRGRAVAAGSTDEICRQAGRETLEEAFLALTGIEQDVAEMSDSLLRIIDTVNTRNVDV